MPPSKEEDNRKRLEKLSVKDLRHQAAVCNVPLQRIAAAIEKQELVNLILAAGPVLDTYDVSLGAKVHTAESIAKGVVYKKDKSKKDKKKKKRRSSSSSSSSSDKGKKRKRSRSRKKGKADRSPSLEMIMAPPQPSAAAERRKRAREAAKALALPAPGGEKAVAPVTDIVVIGGDEKPSTTPSAPAEEKKTTAQAGMEAAAALGFDVLPKAPTTNLQSAPGLGLRPSLNQTTQASLSYNQMAGASMQPGARICIAYLSHTRCELGANCPEAHIIDPEEEMRVRARFKQQECNYGSTCTRQGCLFRHPGEKLEEAVSLMDMPVQMSLPGTRRG